MICMLQRKKIYFENTGEQICIRYYSSMSGTCSPLLKSPISLFNRKELGKTATFNIFKLRCTKKWDHLDHIIHAEDLKGLNCFKVVFLLFHGLGLFNITRTPAHLLSTQKVTLSAEQNKRKEEFAQSTWSFDLAGLVELTFLSDTSKTTPILCSLQITALITLGKKVLDMYEWT